MINLYATLFLSVSSPHRTSYGNKISCIGKTQQIRYCKTKCPQNVAYFNHTSIALTLACTLNFWRLLYTVDNEQILTGRV